MTKSQPAYPTDLNDSEKCIIAPLLPKPYPRGRPYEHARHDILNAICYVVRSGCAWRMLPRDRPPWKTVYHHFRLWRNDGTWERINRALREALRERMGRQRQPSAAILDSQTVKTVEGGDARGFDAGQKIAGASGM